MKVFCSSEAEEIFRAGKSTGHLVAQTSAADVVVLGLAPGDRIPPHALDIPVLFAVAEGSAVLSAGEESCELAAGDVAEVPPGELREWTNTTDEPCRIFVMKGKASA